MREEDSEGYISRGGQGVRAEKPRVGGWPDLSPTLQVRPLLAGPVQR